MTTMIAVPCMDMVHSEFFQCSVFMEDAGEVRWAVCRNTLIYEARNDLAALALEEGFDRVLWLDSDMSFPPSLLRRLSTHLDQGREMVTGLYFTRKDPILPVIYRELNSLAVSYTDYERDALFPVAACGFGAVLMTADLIRAVAEKYPRPFQPEDGFGEDLSFCRHVGQIGKTIWCDASIRLGHIGTAVFDEEAWRLNRAIPES